MADFVFEFEVICYQCGRDLDTRQEVKQSSLSPHRYIVHVAPCSSCLDDAKSDLLDTIEDKESEIMQLEERIEELGGI